MRRRAAVVAGIIALFLASAELLPGVIRSANVFAQNSPRRAKPPLQAGVPVRASRAYPLYEKPVTLAWPQDAAELKPPLFPLVTYWDNNLRPDLLVGDGEGRIWLVRLERPASPVKLKSAEPLLSGGQEIRAKRPCQPNYADINGDGAPDLVVSSEQDVYFYPNTGTRTQPEFGEKTLLAAKGGAPVLPQKIDGRLEVADWNRDGLLDLIAADSDGNVFVFLNRGNKTQPQFDSGIRATLNGKPIRRAYSPCIRFFDANGDARPDLVMGLNWGYVSFFLNDSYAGLPNFRREVRAHDAGGEVLNIKKHMHPAFGDVNGDGILDMIYGTDLPELFYVRGLDKIWGTESP